ncbi:MAG: hypothetical protein SYC29_06435 [Planctomycetota bacterium]|nr:hypothetical protein [Planctomycetota bacterium]
MEESGDGTEWAEAFKTLQEALNAVGPEDTIWVADGIYVPSEEEPEGDPDPRTRTFKLINRVKIYGGFQGGEDALDERDPKTNLTRLSGKLQDSRVYHVVTSKGGVTPESILSGFHVEDGSADQISGPYAQGGGMYVYWSSPTVTRCTFRWNYAQYLGGGLLVEQDHSGEPASVLDCTFRDNVGEQGCGMVVIAFLPGQDPVPVVNSVFTGNMADAVGGAYMGYGYGQVAMTNCTLVDNSAATFGGGIYLDDPATDPKITLRNCILWGNTDMEGQDESAQISDPAGNVPDPDDADVAHTCIQGLDELSGNNNIGDDPLFAGAQNSRLCTGSPCIDAGNTDDVPADVFDVDDDLDFSEATPDRDMKGRLMGDDETGPVDMGAYEFRCYADLDGDCDVDAEDLLILLGNWGTSGPGDLDGNGLVNTADLLILLGSWGPCGEPGTVDPPQSVQDCIDLYLNDPVKLEGCIEAMYRAGMP